MSYIASNKEGLKLVKELFSLIREEAMNVDLLEFIVDQLLPKNDNGDILVGYRISENSGGSSSFSLSENYLNLSLDSMYKWIDRNGLILGDKFNVKDDFLFKEYMFLYILCHEIEHSYQYLMAYGAIDAPCDLVRDGYKLIIDTLISRNYDKIGMLKNIRNKISHYLYFKNSYKYVIERNANVETFDLLQLLALENDHEELSKIFNDMRNSFGIFGYIESNKGCFEETCNGILLGNEYRKLNHDYELSDIDRFRYGLEVSDKFIDTLKLLKRK